MRTRAGGDLTVMESGNAAVMPVDPRFREAYRWHNDCIPRPRPGSDDRRSDGFEGMRAGSVKKVPFVRARDDGSPD